MTKMNEFACKAWRSTDLKEFSGRRFKISLATDFLIQKEFIRTKQKEKCFHSILSFSRK